VRDRTHTLQSLTDDILGEVAERGSLEKVASLYEAKSEIGRELMTLTSALQDLATKKAEVNYGDLSRFVANMRGAR